MLKRILKPFQFVVVLFAVVAAFVAVTVHAGGWATITVADLPDHFVAGQAVNLTFTVRQHGVKLMDDLTPSLEAVNGPVKTSATITKEGTKYHAKLTLPKSGEWTITIKSSFGPNDVTLLPIQAIAAQQAAKPLSATERGRRLYVAKGCAECHQHDGAGVKGRFPSATNLTNKHYSETYLTQLLSDPQKILPPKNYVQMPNLNLKPNEIAALVSFVKAGNKNGAD